MGCDRLGNAWDSNGSRQTQQGLKSHDVNPDDAIDIRSGCGGEHALHVTTGEGEVGRGIGRLPDFSRIELAKRRLRTGRDFDAGAGAAGSMLATEPPGDSVMAPLRVFKRE